MNTTIDQNATLLAGTPLSETEHVIIGITLVIVTALSVAGNGLVLVLLWRFRSLRNKTALLIVNLAVADLGMSVVGFPISVSANFGHSWFLSSLGCQVYGFIGMMFGIGSIGLLTLISIDRYLLTCRHSMFLRLRKRHYVLSVTIAWNIAAFWALAPLVGWCRYAVDIHGVACLVSMAESRDHFVTYTMLLFTTGFLLPCFVIVFCYWNTWRFFWSVGEGGRHENAEWTHEKQIAKMCGVAISLFLVAWTPYAAVCLWSLFGDISSIPSQILVVPSMFAKSSACYNPVVYALVNKRYRLAMKILVGLKKPRRPSFVLHLYKFDQHKRHIVWNIAHAV